MSTQKWSDDELDAFFRRSTEEADPAYDPAGWQDLKARLNNLDDRWPVLRWVLPALLLLLFVGSVVWYELLPGTETPVLTVKKTAIVGQPAQSGQATLAGKSAPDAPTAVAVDPPETGQSNLTPNKPTAKRLPLVKSVESVTRFIPDIKSEKLVLPAGKKVSGTAAVTDQPTERKKPDHQPLSTDQPATLSQPPAYTSQDDLNKNSRLRASQYKTERTLGAGRRADPPNGTARQDAKTGGLGRHRSGMSGLVNLNRTATGHTGSNTPANWPDTAPPPAETLADQELRLTSEDRHIWQTPDRLASRQMVWPTGPGPVTEPVLPIESGRAPRLARPRLSGLSVQAVLSPDLSTIGLHNFDRPGSNIGGMVQYQLSERFSVQSGVLWSTKFYSSLASEYIWPANVGMTVWPKSITGRCTMLDIPLNLRYDLFLRPGGPGRGPIRWFVSGGVTSYFIRREAYDYNYAQPNDPAIKYRSWALNKGSSFGLSNINVSVGYERPISRRLSWQIEPFMKIPVQQIGYFKVRLLSSGAFLSLRYRL